MHSTQTNDDLSIKDFDGCLKFISQWEGLRLHPYYCTAKKKTIGVGFNLEAPGAEAIIEELCKMMTASLPTKRLLMKSILKQKKCC
jgi:GH24 family phage-related lysozyme (muramidase)